MIDVALLGIIRRWHLRDQVPLREIARRLGISRNTVRRYLRSETTEPSYAERRSSSLLDKYSVQLSAWLKAEASKPRKQRRNLKQLHLELKELGYEGSYDRVAAFARQWKVGQSEWVNSASKRTRIGRLQEKHLNLVSQITSTDKLEQSLRNTPLLSGLDIGEFLPTLSTAIGQNDNEAKELATLRSSSPDVIAVRAEGLRLANLQEDTDTEREKNATALANLERELDQLRNRPTSGKTPEQIQSSLLESDSALQNISQNVLESLAKLDLLQAEEDALKIKAADKKKLLDELDFKLTNLRQTEQDLAKRWSSNGYAGTPLPITVQRLDESLEHVSVRLQQVLQEHGVLLDGRRRYLANEELQQLEARLKAECDKHGVHNIESVLSKLDTQMLALKKRTESLSRVQEKRTNLLSQLKQKATDIRNAVSEPLNANTERFCAALMSDRAYPVSLSAIASATTAQALLSFQPDGKGEAKNPLLYMSEGQLAATSLCLLFGASATYPWSRWKGLLMDDPLHHNDSIHAAAFIDVVRNLIRSQGYQIIVSTHDMDQAGYFLRKCRNAGITARYHHLYGRADDGTALLQSA